MTRRQLHHTVATGSLVFFAFAHGRGGAISLEGTAHGLGEKARHWAGATHHGDCTWRWSGRWTVGSSMILYSRRRVRGEGRQTIHQGQAGFRTCIVQVHSRWSVRVFHLISGRHPHLTQARLHGLRRETSLLASRSMGPVQAPSPPYLGCTSVA